MANIIKFSLIVTCVVLVLTGCSGSSGPSTPGTESDPSDTSIPISDRNATESANNHYCLLYNLIYIDATDPDSIEYEIVPLRATSMHLNILKLLEVGPCTDCFKIVGFNFPEPGILDVDIEITHPFDDLNFTIFDVRGIMMFNGSHLFPESGLTMSDSSMGDGELLNAEGFTRLYNGSTLGMAGDFFTYYEGKFATPTVPNADLNGFIRHITYGAANTRNVLYPADSEKQTYSLALPSGEFVLGYAVDASWDIPDVDPVTDPMTDFPITANCIEPWRIEVSSDPINGDGSTTLTIDVFDWQGKESHAAPIIECSELFHGYITASFTENGSGYSTWEAIIVNNNSAPNGKYLCLVSVEDNANASSPDYIDLTAYELYKVHINPSNDYGNLIWAKRAGGTSYTENGYGITTLSDKSTVVTGCFEASAIFGEGEANETVLISDGFRDIFIARYNPDGTLAWAKSAGGTSFSDRGFGITSLSDDSTVLTGQIRGSATFGKGEPNETVLVSAGQKNRPEIFVARYNPDGTLAWAVRAGGTWDDTGFGITTLSDDSTVVTGIFSESATFGEGEPNETVLVAGYFDHLNIFIARYNPDSTLAWAKWAGGDFDDRANGITTLSDDSTVVTGRFLYFMIFGKGEPNETVLDCKQWDEDLSDIFIARYNPDGTLAWAKQAGGKGDDRARGITTLSDNSTVVIGSFGRPATFGKGEANETVLEATEGLGFFLARYNHDGTLAWAKRAGGTSSDYGNGFTTLSDNSTVITGSFWGTAIFGEGEPNETVLVPDGDGDIFVARYNPDGTFAWANRAGGLNQDLGSGITTLSDNSFVVTGYFEGTATFGEGEPNETVLESDGGRDIFIARFAP